MPPLRLSLVLPVLLSLMVAGGALPVSAAEPAAPGLEAMPDGADIWEAYPRTARAFEVEGQAGLDCVVGADGSLQSCKAVSEIPAGYGFGEAALTLAPRFKVTTRGPGGEDFVGRSQRFDVGFRLPFGDVPVEPADVRGWPSPEGLLPERRRPRGLHTAVLAYACRLGPARELTGCSLEWSVASSPDYARHAARWLGLLKAKPQTPAADGVVRLRIDITTVDERSRNWLLAVGDFPEGDEAEVEALGVDGLSLKFGAPPLRLGRGDAGEGPLRLSDDAGPPALFYPPNALKKGLGGRMVVNCRAGKEGRLRDCMAGSLSPDDTRPFSQAVEVFAPYLRLAPGPDRPEPGRTIIFELLFSPGADRLTPDIRYLPGRPFSIENEDADEGGGDEED